MAIGRLQLDFHRHVVAGHDHFRAAQQLGRAGHVGRAEVELRTIAGEERRVTAALFLGQHVDFGLELRVRRDRLRGSASTWPRSRSSFFNAAEQHADVVAGLAFVQRLVERFDAGDDGGLVRLEADDLDRVADLAPCRARYGRCRPCRDP